MFDTTRLLLTTLGYPLFERLVIQNIAGDSPTNEVTYGCAGKGGASALGRYTPEGFVVLSGSTARKQLVDSLQNYEPFVVKRQALLESGKLIDAEEMLTFTEDVLFSSPSLAATMVLGRSSNGWLDWISSDGKSLDMIERKQV